MANAFKTDWTTAGVGGVNNIVAYNTGSEEWRYNIPGSHYRTILWDGADFDVSRLISSTGFEPDFLHLNSNYRNLATRWNYYDGFVYDRGGNIQNVIISTKPYASCAWMDGALTDPYNINLYIDKFVPNINDLQPTNTTWHPIFGYNPLIYTESSFALGRWSRTITRNSSTRYIRLQAGTDSNGYGTLLIKTSSNGSSWSTSTYTQGYFRNGLIPNRLIMLASAGGGGGYNSSSGSYGGGGAGAWCAVVINTYWLKEDTSRFYTIDLGSKVNAGAGTGSHGSDLSMYTYNGNYLFTLGGGKGATGTSSGASGGTFTERSYKGTYWWPLYNGSNAALLNSSNFAGQASGSTGSSTIYVSTSYYCATIARTSYSRSRTYNYCGGASIFGNGNSNATAGPGAGGKRGYAGGAAQVVFYY